MRTSARLVFLSTWLLFSLACLQAAPDVTDAGGSSSDDAGVTTGLDDAGAALDAGAVVDAGAVDAGMFPPPGDGGMFPPPGDGGMFPPPGDGGLPPDDAGGFVVALVQVGPAADGGALSAAGAAVAIALVDQTGTTTQTLPITGAFSLSGSTTTEGVLNVTPDGALLTLAGYGVAPGKGSVASGTTRTIAVVPVDGGAVDLSTTLTEFTSSVRAAATVDGNAFYVTGSAGTAGDAGVRLATLGQSGAATRVSAEVSSTRAAHVVNGELFVSSSTNATTDAGTSSHVFSLGALPTAPTPATYLPGVSLSTPHDFALLDLDAQVAGVDTLYVVDDGSTGGMGADAGTVVRGVQKYLFDGTTWSLSATLTAAKSCNTVTAFAAGAGAAVVLCVSSDGSTVYRFDDAPLQSVTVSTFATAPTGTLYRGLVRLP